MYQNWFLTMLLMSFWKGLFPHLTDGLKPVQRRILHSMKGWMMVDITKPNIVGHTHAISPSWWCFYWRCIGTIRTKRYSEDCQGNWGNILTGDRELRLLVILKLDWANLLFEVVFNPKNYESGNIHTMVETRNRLLPVKFPLLLAQGMEGIAVGLFLKSYHTILMN